MNSFRKLSLILCTIFMFSSLGFGQLIFSGDDDYIGGVTPGTGTWHDADNISSPLSSFELTGWAVNVDGSSLTVKIFAENYFDNIISGSNLLGTSLGDLFISKNPLAWSTTEESKLDFFESSNSYTPWDYGVKLGTYVGSGLETPQTGALFQIDNSVTAVNQIELSDDHTTGTYRKEQEVRIGDGATAVTIPSGTDAPSWYIDTTANFLSITLDDFDTLLGVDKDEFQLSFHWAMTCANDTIEFEVRTFDPAVPEPHTVGLLGATGVLGILFLRRRFVK